MYAKLNNISFHLSYIAIINTLKEVCKFDDVTNQLIIDHDNLFISTAKMDYIT